MIESFDKKFQCLSRLTVKPIKNETNESVELQLPHITQLFITSRRNCSDARIFNRQRITENRRESQRTRFTVQNQPGYRKKTSSRETVANRYTNRRLKESQTVFKESGESYLMEGRIKRSLRGLQCLLQCLQTLGLWQLRCKQSVMIRPVNHSDIQSAIQRATENLRRIS